MLVNYAAGNSYKNKIKPIDLFELPLRCTLAENNTWTILFAVATYKLLFQLVFILESGALLSKCFLFYIFLLTESLKIIVEGKLVIKSRWRESPLWFDEKPNSTTLFGIPCRDLCNIQYFMRTYKSILAGAGGTQAGLQQDNVKSLL